MPDLDVNVDADLQVEDGSTERPLNVKDFAFGNLINFPWDAVSAPPAVGGVEVFTFTQDGEVTGVITVTDNAGGFSAARA